jgi:ribosomal protein L7/L12
VLPAEALWLLLGVSIGYFLGIWVGRRPAAVVECPQPQRLGQEDNPGAAFTDLSDSVKAMADDGRKLEAVKLHMEQKGLELQKAKDAVESYMGKRG